MGWREVEFIGSDSFERLQKLQTRLLCADSDVSSVDALLLVGGVDSFHSTLSQAALKFLFLGASGQELLGAQVISQQHERLEDVVLFITAERVAIFYSSEGDAAVKVLPMIARWRNVQELTFHDAMDPDEQEARKIRAFKAMVAGVKRIGIPYGLDADGRDLQDPMVPEKWPLIQSYGLENDVDGATAKHRARSKGFFTMNHEVVNVSSALRDLMLELDAFSAKRVAQEVAPLLSHHYAQFLLKLDHAESPEARNSRSELEMGEDLLSFYEFGTMQYDTRGLRVLPNRGSRVLFGTRTSDLSHKSSSTVFLKDAGASAFPATHMLVQVEDPFSGVRFARTYFLSTAKVCSRIVDEDALVHPVSEQLEQHADTQSNARDTQLLIELYVLLLRGFKRALKELVAHISNSSGGAASLQKYIAEATSKALSAMSEYSRAQSHVLQENPQLAALDESLVLSVECLDARGCSTDFRADSINLLYVSMSFDEIPSKVEPTKSLGSLMVSDSILLKSTKLISVTESFPYFRSWIRSGKEADFVRALLATLRSEFMLQSPAIRLGHAVATMDAMVDNVLSVSNGSSSTSAGDQNQDSQAATQVALAKAVLLLSCEELSSVSGSMRLFSGGFVFLTPHMNPILVSFAKHVRSFRVIPTQFEELVLLRIELKPDAHTGATPLSESLPFAFSKQDLFIPLLSGSRFQEEILRVLNSAWKSSAEALEIPFYRPHDLSLAFDGATPRDNSQHSGSNSDELPLVIRKACEELVKNQRNASSARESLAAVEDFFPKWFIPKDANPVTTLGKPNQDLRKLCVPITVMLGIPGSDVARIAKSICEFSSGSNDWKHVLVDARDADIDPGTKKDGSQDPELYEQYAFRQIQLKLTETLELVRSSVSPVVHPRIMLSVIGYVDPITVAAAIKQLAAASSSPPPLQVKLSLLVACVSATNVYLPDPLAAQCPFPKLFDQLTAGFTTHVVLTHSSEVSASQLGRLRFHIDQVNPFADIQCLSQDVFEGPITSLLAVDRFESVYYTKYRDAHFPGWADESSSASKSPSKYVAELYALDSVHNDHSASAMALPETLRFQVAPGMERSRFLHLVASTLTPFAVFSKALEKMHPESSLEKTKGIRLAQALAADKWSDEFGWCWCVDGRISFAGEPESVYHYVSTGTSVRMRVESKQRAQQGDGGESGGSAKLELQITGVGLDATKLHDLLLNCYAHVERSVAPMRSKSSVSIEEKREIQKRHAMDPLPEGFLYDGSNYVDFFGGRYEFHPNIAQFIDEHIAAANESTKQTNAKAEENRHAQQTFVKRVC